ncbi:MAG: isochorismatase family protein [Alphaproteobacteria bacterium]|nr:isochorismatase family protein [Alphaproteobacteria bacterium]
MLLESAKTSLLIVDVQERLLPAVQQPERVLSRNQILLKAAEILEIPVTISEQYSKGLGRTVTGLASNHAKVFEKITFSCWRDKAMRAHFIEHHERERPLIIVSGIEAHVCVLQSCIDLYNAGFGVFAVADAMSSRQADSAALALDRLRGAGIQVINTEMAVFELMEKAGTPEFKTLSALIK